MQVTIPACPNRSSTSPSRSRRVKTRHRKPGKGSSGDLAGLKANQSSSNRETTVQVNNATTNNSKQLLEPSAALRELSHEQQQRHLSSSSPDLICTTLEAEGQGKREPSVSGLERGGSLSASAGLGGSEGGAAGLDDLTETPPRSDTPSEDAASFPFSSSPDSPCGRGAAAGRGSLGSPRLSHDGEDKDEGASAVRIPRGASGGIGTQHLTPSAILRPTSITKCQSVSTFSSENLSVSDGEEGHTTDHSHSGTPDVVSTNTDDRLDDRSDDLLSQGSEIPADNTDPAQASDGLSEKDGTPGQSKAQLDAGQNHNEVKEAPQRFAYAVLLEKRKEQHN
ncbi:hypothetical protein GOODEAATRI_004884 [Goodea atripinnis]|uniref:Uncharacterized protein n=1 Tax=Goodea atripinnis TaxID=208336 RepID=A0ABV0NHX5_9TELE